MQHCSPSHRAPGGNRGAIVKESETEFVNSRKHESQPGVTPKKHISLCHSHRMDFDANRKPILELPSEKENSFEICTPPSSFLRGSKREQQGSTVADYESSDESSAIPDADNRQLFKKLKSTEPENNLLFCLPYGGGLKQLDAISLPLSSFETQSLTIAQLLKRVEDRMPSWSPLVLLGFHTSKGNDPETIVKEDHFKLRLQNFNFKGSSAFVVFKAISMQESVTASRIQPAASRNQQLARNQSLASARRLITGNATFSNETDIQLRRRVVNTCLVNDKHKEGCFILADGRHLLLSSDHIRQWVNYLSDWKNEDDPHQTQVTLSNPPDIPIFDGKNAVSVKDPPYSRALQSSMVPQMPQSPNQVTASAASNNPLTATNLVLSNIPVTVPRRFGTARIALERNIAGNLDIRDHSSSLFVGPEDSITTLLETIGFPFERFDSQSFTYTGYVSGMQFPMNGKLLESFGTSEELNLRCRVSDKVDAFFEDYE
ncbi:hypothetical protein BDR26DRAFT_916986 [Obelidium mucronatum]|nr:hypothetical protein BDR26DRAFT_916986 [Obelidium mucronatum]